MKKNVASQVVGAQMVSATDGSAFTSAVTVSVTGDGGTQATGSVGSGACTHEGNGFHTYAPAQAETNYDHVAFTFTGTGAVPATVQIYTTFPQTGDNFARLGAPAGASVSADVAAIKTETASILADTATLPTATPGAAGGLFIAGTNAATTITTGLTTTFTGNLTGSVGSVTGAVGSVTARVTANTDQLAGQTVTAGAGVTFPTSVASPTNITAGTITTVTNLTNAATAGDFTATMKTSIGTAVAASAVASVTGNVGGNVTGSVGSVASGGLTAASFAADSITAAKLAADVTTELQAGLATSASITTLTGYVDTEVAAIKAVTDKLDTALELDVAVYRFTVNALELAPAGGSGLDAAGVRAAIGLASANLDTQLGTIDDFLDTEVAAIKAKTDSLTFTVANQIDANIQSVNGANVTGDGQPGTEWGP